MSEMETDLQIRPISVTEYHALGESGFFGPDERVELLDGMLIAMPPIGPDHAYATRRLIALLAKRFDGLAIVDVGLPLALSEYSEPQPDVMLLRHQLDFYAGRHPDASDVHLLIEVSLSSLRIDRGRKLRAYARAGVAEFWIVDLVHRCIERFREPRGDTFGDVATFEIGESLAPLAFPSQSFDVADIIAPKP